MRRHRTDDKEFSEINITPFTDVILVLLLIFMITTPALITGSIKVKLPAATATEESKQGNIRVYLDNQNRIFLNDREMTIDELKMNIQVEFINQNSHDVVVMADRNSLHGSFVQLLDVLKSAGAAKLSIATDKK